LRLGLKSELIATPPRSNLTWTGYLNRQYTAET
jgi:hypothetical protein